MIVPTWPVNVKVLAVWKHTSVSAPEIVPATDVGLTVTVAAVVVADGQTPLVTVAL